MQSVIVYRNPLEAALWESLASLPGLGYLVPVVVGLLVGILVYALVLAIGGRVVPRYSYHRRGQSNPLMKTANWLAVLVGLAVMGSMFKNIF